MTLGALMLDLEGLTLAPAEADLLRHPHVGGVILFARNFSSVEQVTALVQAIRAVRPGLIIAVDQEGGRVQRFREGFVKLPPMKVFGDLYATDPDTARQRSYQCGWLMASEVLATGVDISFAPILDVDCGLSQVIGDRAFHADPQVAVKLLREFIRGMHDAGMAATGKHFPGHGSVAADSHIALPVDDRPWAEIEALDLVPFAALARELQGIMPAHVIYSKVDPLPAGFSPFWLQDILRSRLGFDGVIFSDDLSMEGAVATGSFSDRANAALDAGCDMVLVCNHREGALEVLEALSKRGQFPEQRRFEALRGRFRHNWDSLHADASWTLAKDTVGALA
ncbi:MAG: glycosyl hydrolase [Moraxellaceae bacterium]|jgi:beta-N-acetylhexosaminidase|nr:glycosyl hydrolase [Moraxellaceae bacterium]